MRFLACSNLRTPAGSPTYVGGRICGWKTPTGWTLKSPTALAVLRGDSSVIRYRGEESAELREFLEGPVAGLWNHVTNAVVLHGAAACGPVGVIGILGPSFSGKSALVATAASCGAMFWADDLLTLRLGRRGVVSTPGLPRVRLRVGKGQRDVVPMKSPAARPRRLTHLLALQTPRGRRLEVRELHGAERIPAVLMHVYTARIDPRPSPDHSRTLLSAVASCRVFEVRMPEGLSRLRSGWEKLCHGWGLTPALGRLTPLSGR